MTEWILSVTETEVLRNTADSQPDPSLYRKGELIALVHRDAVKRDVWHLLLSTKGNVRDPELVELMDAYAALLPRITPIFAEAVFIEDGCHPAVRCLHFYGTYIPEKRELLQ